MRGLHEREYRRGAKEMRECRYTPACYFCDFDRRNPGVHKTGCGQLVLGGELRDIV